MHAVLGQTELGTSGAVDGPAADIRRPHSVRSRMRRQHSQSRELPGSAVHLAEQPVQGRRVPFKGDLHGLVPAARGQRPSSPTPLLPFGALQRVVQVGEVNRVAHAHVPGDDVGKSHRVEGHALAHGEDVPHQPPAHGLLHRGRRTHVHGVTERYQAVRPAEEFRLSAQRCE